MIAYAKFNGFLTPGGGGGGGGVLVLAEWSSKGCSGRRAERDSH